MAPRLRHSILALVVGVLVPAFASGAQKPTGKDRVLPNIDIRITAPRVAPALDAGARGIMAPMMESADEARVLVDSARYPPEGKRGFGVIMRDELDGGPAAAAERANRDNVLIAQIESEAGIEHAAEIVAVPGIDAVWLGQFDLSLSLGVPGDFGHPRFDEAVDHLLGVCRSAGKPVGQLIGSAQDGAAAAARGRADPKEAASGKTVRRRNITQAGSLGRVVIDDHGIPPYQLDAACLIASGKSSPRCSSRSMAIGTTARCSASATSCARSSISFHRSRRQ